MCNRVHADHEKLSESETSGIGYKLFDSHLTEKGRILRSLVDFHNYKESDDHKIRWTNKNHDGDGFCFFFNLEEARRASKIWGIDVAITRITVIRKINFKKAICKQTEDMFIYGCEFEMGICEEFEPVLKKGEYI